MQASSCRARSRTYTCCAHPFGATFDFRTQPSPPPLWAARSSQRTREFPPAGRRRLDHRLISNGRHFASSRTIGRLGALRPAGNQAVLHFAGRRDRRRPTDGDPLYRKFERSHGSCCSLDARWQRLLVLEYLISGRDSIKGQEKYLLATPNMGSICPPLSTVFQPSDVARSIDSEVEFPRKRTASGKSTYGKFRPTGSEYLVSLRAATMPETCKT